MLGAYDHDFGNLYGTADHHIMLNADEMEVYYDAVHHNLSETPTWFSRPVSEISPEDTLSLSDVNVDVEDMNETSTQPVQPATKVKTGKAKKVKKEKVFHYRSVAKGDAQIRDQRYYQKIGLYFTDRSEDGGLRRIVDVQRCTSLAKGRGSRTLFYKLFDPDMFPHLLHVQGRLVGM